MSGPHWKERESQIWTSRREMHLTRLERASVDGWARNCAGCNGFLLPVADSAQFSG